MFLFTMPCQKLARSQELTEQILHALQLVPGKALHPKIEIKFFSVSKKVLAHLF